MTWDSQRDNARRKERRRTDPEWCKRQAAYKMKSNYGITIEEYEDLLAAQSGVCAICFTDNPDPSGRKKMWSVDHDHETGVVRGLLCDLCNKGIGFLKDDPDRLRNAAKYLEGVSHGC